MGILDQIDKESLVCTFCGLKPVVGYTFAVDAEIDYDSGSVNRELVQNSIVATCAEHLPILQEEFEKDVKGAEFLEGDEDVPEFDEGGNG